MCKPTILLVDNDADMLGASRDYLVLKGYDVLIAQNRLEALARCQQDIVHLAVIDVRLINDNDEEDLSGLNLAKEIGPAIIKIILTGHQYTNPADPVSRALAPDDDGEVLASDFAWKRRGPSELLKKIEIALKQRVKLGKDLKITFAKGINWRTLVEQLKMFRGLDDENKRKAERVLEDLTRRLFHQANAVQLLPMALGYGGCTVVEARPSQDRNPGVHLVVKLGPRDNIAQEVKNYERWVRPFASFRTTGLQLGPVISRDMGAIAYTFVGTTDVASVVGFRSYYDSKDDKQISDTLQQLFSETCGLWYKGKHPPAETEPDHLDQWYRKSLRLDGEARIKELTDACRQLLEQKPSGFKEFRLDENVLQVHLDGKDQLTLPNPISFAVEEYGSSERIDVFPLPSSLAITHGDLHAGNILVDEQGHTWLIDFYKTELGPALRDFAELESNIKFDLIGVDKMRLRYELEVALLAPHKLTDNIQLEVEPTPEQHRALAAIQQLRKLAELLTDTVDVREYYIGLLFFALKRLIGFTSSGKDTRGEVSAKYHALLSAAMICQYLKPK